MLYFDKDITLKVIDNTLSIGVFDENTYLVANIFSNELYTDVCTSEELMYNYGVEVDQIDFN